jgi:hypothetical protein
MTTAPNPYASDLGTRDPLQALADTPARIRSAVRDWTPAQFERTYAPGKWSIRKVLIHLAQTELALGTRVRFALTQREYAAQSFSQDEWLPLDETLDAAAALEVYAALRRMTVAMFRTLPASALGRQFTHPEYGVLTVGWVAAQMAGHDLHHLKQITAAGVAAT